MQRRVFMRTVTTKLLQFPQEFYAFSLILVNRPFPSSYLPPLQSESKCNVFVMVISSTLHMNEN